LPAAAQRAALPRLGFATLLGLFLLVHAGVIGFLIYADLKGPSDIAAPAEEIPVEIIVEPPKEEPKLPPPPEMQPPPSPEDLRPAMSMPRAASDPEINANGIQQKTSALQTNSKPQEGQPTPAGASKVEPSAAAPTLKDVEDRQPNVPDAEAIGKAGPENPAKRDDSEVKNDQKTLANVLNQLSTTTLSDFSFAQKTKVAPITGGLEDNRYLANVWAQIMSKRQFPQRAAARHAKGSVTISFVLDDNGRVVYQAMSKSSGDRDLDTAAASAVKSGAPYPPPPFGMPHSLVATIEF
jgi:protein TonB